MWKAPATTPGQLPEPKGANTKLLVRMAFDKGEDGELMPAFEARQMPDERRAVSTANEMSRRHVGVIAWMRDANPAQASSGRPRRYIGLARSRISTESPLQLCRWPRFGAL